MVPGPSTPADWPSLLQDRAAFQNLADSKSILTHLSQHLWEAFTHALQHTALQQDLRQALSAPPTLEDFKLRSFITKVAPPQAPRGLPIIW